MRAATLCKGARFFPILNRQDTRRDLLGDPGGGTTVAEPQKVLSLEEELRDRRVCTSVELGFKVRDVGLIVGGIRVTVRIGAHADGELVQIGQRPDQFDRTGKATRVLRELLGPLRRITAQRDNLGRARSGVALGHLERLFPRGVNAGQVARDVQAVVLLDHLDGRARDLARGSAGSVGDGNEVRVQSGQSVDRVPQLETSLERLRREKLQRESELTGYGFGRLGH